MDPAHGQEKSASLGRRHPDPRQFGMKIPSLIRRQKSQIFYFRAQQKKRPAAFMLLAEKMFHVFPLWGAKGFICVPVLHEAAITQSALPFSTS